MKKKEFLRGVRDGMPIGIGYFAVAFAVGISAKRAGMSALAASLMSLLNLTSAGEAAAISLFAVGTTITELVLTQLVINARYFLMSCSMSQHLGDVSAFHRFCVAFGVTDEIFAISSAAGERLYPEYCYGAMALAIPGWTIGTLGGVIFGSILPDIVVSSLGTALYGMFISIIMPVCKKDKAVTFACVAGMVISFAMTNLPVVSAIPTGFRLIIITVAVSAVAALAVPIKEGENG